MGQAMTDQPGIDDETLHSASVLLQQMQDGNSEASARLYTLLYQELKSLARRKTAGQRVGHTLHATAVLNEAWIRLNANEGLQATNRQHFLRIAARAMRGVLIDHARARSAEKRRTGIDKVPLDEALITFEENHGADPVIVDEALTLLREHDTRLADVIDLRFFAGLSESETAEALALTRRQVQHAWKLARAWLRRALDHRNEDTTP